MASEMAIGGEDWQDPIQSNRKARKKAQKKNTVTFVVEQ